jgi:hypothetical protein
MCFKYLDHVRSAVATFSDCLALVGVVLRAQLLPGGLDLLEVVKVVVLQKVAVVCDLHVVGIGGVLDGLVAVDTLNEELLENHFLLFVLCRWFYHLLDNDDNDDNKDEEIPDELVLYLN